MDFNVSKPEPYIAAMMAGISFGLLLALIYFIMVCEVHGRRKELSVKSIFTPFSSLLMLMITSQMGVYFCEIFAFSEKAYRWTSEYARLYAAQGCFIVIQEAAYLFYSYLRAAPLLEEVFPRTAPALALGMKLMPILFVFQVGIGVARVLSLDNPEALKIISECDQVIPALIALFIFAFDVTSLVAFTKFLKRTSVTEKKGEDNQFLIISRHGIASVVVCLLIIVCYTFNVLLGDADAFLAGFLFSTVMYLLLFRMKVMLHFEKKERENKVQERIKSLNRATTYQASASV